MNDKAKRPFRGADAIQQSIREARHRYDALDRGQTAPLRRCRTANEVGVEGVYWCVAGSFGQEQNLSHVVLLFPLASQSTQPRFSFGQYLRRHLGDTDGAKLRVRRLLACRDREELGHRLRGVLKLANATSHPVDWGILGSEILWFFAENGNARRRWAEGFYAPQTRDTNSENASDVVNT